MVVYDKDFVTFKAERFHRYPKFYFYHLHFAYLEVNVTLTTKVLLVSFFLCSSVQNSFPF